MSLTLLIYWDILGHIAHPSPDVYRGQKVRNLLIDFRPHSPLVAVVSKGSMLSEIEIKLLRVDDRGIFFTKFGTVWSMHP